MKKEKILLNRIIIYTMTLWVRKTFIGLVLLPAFFLSCEREDLEIGLPPQDNIFNLNYLEYVPQATMFWRDSIRSGSPDRLLVGEYFDNHFGRVSAQGYTELDMDVNDYIYIAADAIVERMDLKLVHDYTYGADNYAIQRFDVYLLQSNYDSATLFNPYKFKGLLLDSLIGSVDYTLGIPDGKADTLTVNLSQQFAEVIFDSLKTNTELMKKGRLRDLVTGISIKTGLANKGILGFNAGDGQSRIELYYRQTIDGDLEKMTIDFSAFRHNQISPNAYDFDRTGTPLEGLTTFYQSYDPNDGKIYLQEGGGVSVTLDMLPFTAVMDTVDNIVINNAYLEISNPEDTYPFNYVPSTIDLWLTNASNRYQFLNGNARKIYDNNRSDSLSVAFGNSSNLFPTRLKYQMVDTLSKEGRYLADITFFIQNVIDDQADLTQILLSTPSDRHSVNRLVTDRNNVKIKLFYTTRVKE